MNPLLAKLQPYPFERLRQLFAGVTPNPAFTPISLGIGEPKHPTPTFIKDALSAGLGALAAYPATAGELRLREAFTGWLQTRYGLVLDAATQVLPVNGSREALFALAQTVVDPTRDAVVLSPNPFYQIYEGAALLAGADVHYVPSVAERNFAVDWGSVPDEVWARTQLVFVCSPGNPTGAVMPIDEWRKLFALSDQHGFVIASDECYSEIYFPRRATGSALWIAGGAIQAGRKRLREPHLASRQPVQAQQRARAAQRLRGRQCRADQGLFAVPHLPWQRHEPHRWQAASIAAWGDEQHVVENRALYRKPSSRPGHPPAGAA